MCFEMKITERNGICRLEKYDGNDGNLCLPNEVDGEPLSVIGAKAFLSCRSVERLELPDGTESVEDWAFAHMRNLKEIVIPAKKIVFGRKVFLGCHHLKRISFSGTEGIYEGIPYFLASMATCMEEHPLAPELAGNLQGQWSWLKDYDKTLLGFLDREDTYGFEPAFIGWFNVEDVDDQQEAYIKNQKKNKIALGLQRLLYGERLEEETEGRISAYLLNAWKLVVELFAEKEAAYGRDVRYMKIWQKIGGLKILTSQELLERLPDADPEVRAYLMQCEFTEKRDVDFFAGLEL